MNNSRVKLLILKLAKFTLPLFLVDPSFAIALTDSELVNAANKGNIRLVKQILEEKLVQP